MTLSPAEASIYVDGQGYAPVPTVCPRCGYKTRRKGNASNRQVHCTNYATHTTENGIVFKDCSWHASVYGGHRS